MRVAFDVLVICEVTHLVALVAGDRDMTFHAERAGARGDLLDLEMAQRAAIVHVAQQPLVGRSQLRPRRVGPYPEHNGVILAEIPGEQFLAGQQVRMQPQLLEGTRYIVARSHHVTDVQVRRHLHIHSPNRLLRRPVERVGNDAGIPGCLIPISEALSAADRHRLQAVLVCAQPGGLDREIKRLILAIDEPEICLSRSCRPALRQL